MFDSSYDLAVIGGGVNGCGVARDAAGRGLTVLLVEQDDLASATSSASTKLIHGGLRYLEYGHFRLVREALSEREVLWQAAPHLVRPLRFVLPVQAGARPAWLLRLGLLIYDHLGGRRLLPGTRVLDLRCDPAGAGLRPGLAQAFEYSDCWVDDARLVVLNAVDARRHGATVLTRTRLSGARRAGGGWLLDLENRLTGATCQAHARAVVNAAGPWAARVATGAAGVALADRLRLVRGSHIIVPRMFDGGAYIVQTSDRRVCFAISYEDDFTLIGTTDVDHAGPPETAAITAGETAYLCAEASRWLNRPVRPEHVVHSFSGVRPLLDDGAREAKAATRDYVLRLDGGEAPFLTVLGGKLTTYRRLAECVLDRLRPWFPGLGPAWTTAPLPGGGFPVDGVPDQVTALRRSYPFLDERWALRLVRAYGTEAGRVLGDARRAADLGTNYGAGLTEAEVRYLLDNEWAVTVEDVLWRRTKLGLRVTALSLPQAGEGLTAITTPRP